MWKAQRLSTRVPFLIAAVFAFIGWYTTSLHADLRDRGFLVYDFTSASPGAMTLTVQNASLSHDFVGEVLLGCGRSDCTFSYNNFSMTVHEPHYTSDISLGPTSVRNLLKLDLFIPADATLEIRFTTSASSKQMEFYVFHTPPEEEVAPGTSTATIVRKKSLFTEVLTNLENILISGAVLSLILAAAWLTIQILEPIRPPRTRKP